ncbi:hypothetical protein [uncultured Polaribacter sp.]|uniref:hypothetical protein n=1 Tax=uncultured Polaribacter sp. TaxID=174711 RepID=UPI00260AABF6|nr:hypothetical protein [uncultured Polaribacter sp.]
MKKHLNYVFIIILTLGIISGCQEDDSFYDVNWPVPTITNVSTYNDLFSSTITLTGNFASIKSVHFGDVAGENLEVSSDESTLMVDVPRTMNIDGAPIKVSNEYSQTYQTAKNFVPIIPATSVLEVSPIQVGLTFTVKGENVDLLTEVKVDGAVVPVVAKKLNSMILSVSGLNLRAGMLVDVSFKSLAKDNIPTAEKIEVVYPFIAYNEVIIWDFKDGTHQYTGEGSATVEYGDVMGTDANYFSLRAPGYRWAKASGNMVSADIPDVSGLTNPYITFAIRTPAGSAGYFQMEDQNGHWRHFGFGFDTGGSWIIISLPLDESWQGGGDDFNPGSFKPRLGFKSGNAGENQDLDIAYVKVTEGKYDGSQEIGDALVGSTKPAKLVVMDFEETSNWPDVVKGGNTVASLDLRKSEINPFFGDQFFTYADDGSLGNWGGYWGQTIATDMSNSQLSIFNDPYISMALNSIAGNAQYLILRVYQYDEQLAMVQKFFPNTNGEWETFQFSLFNTELENWSDASTPLGAHYKTLKTLNIDAPIDRIEVIVGRNNANTIGLSIDDMVITEGPRF